MKNTLIKTSLFAAIIAGLVACSTVTPPNQSGTTTARNAAIGAAVSGPFAPVGAVVGGILGGVIGGVVGHYFGEKTSDAINNRALN